MDRGMEYGTLVVVRDMDFFAHSPLSHQTKDLFKLLMLVSTVSSSNELEIPLNHYI